MALSKEEQKQYDEFRGSVDFKRFTTKPYIRRIDKPWGYELHFTPDTLPYMGKILHVDEGKRLSLQAHDVKRESWFLARGNIILIIENRDGELEEIEMEAGKGYTCALGQRHRLKGGRGGGDVFEVSTPEDGNTYRLDDDFARSTETEAERKKRNQTAK